MTQESKKTILELAKTLEALIFGDFTLSSGQKSKYYFDGRILTLSPRGSYLVGEAILEEVHNYGADEIGGPTLGADPIVSSVILTSYLKGSPINGFLIRSSSKGHGTKQLIEGPMSRKPTTERKPRVLIVDDVCTSGGSLFHAISVAETHGCEVVCVAVILDRNQGGSDAIRHRGYSFVSLLEASQEGSVTIT